MLCAGNRRKQERTGETREHRTPPKQSYHFVPFLKAKSPSLPEYVLPRDCVSSRRTTIKFRCSVGWIRRSRRLRPGLAAFPKRQHRSYPNPPVSRNTNLPKRFLPVAHGEVRAGCGFFDGIVKGIPAIPKTPENLWIYSRQECDLTLLPVPPIIACTSLLRRANKPAKYVVRALMDGAKIYFCYRWCCFLTRKRRSGLLNRLSPRKSRFQSHPSEVRSVP